jgi:hypothetical protein
VVLRDTSLIPSLDPGRRNRLAGVWKTDNRPLEHHQIQHIWRIGARAGVVRHRTMELLSAEPAPQLQHRASPGVDLSSRFSHHTYRRLQASRTDSTWSEPELAVYHPRDASRPALCLARNFESAATQGGALHVPSLSPHMLQRCCLAVSDPQLDRSCLHTFDQVTLSSESCFG